MKTRLRLYHLDSERGLRGGERQLLYLAGHLRQAGHDNVIVCRKGHALDREAARLGFARLHLPFLAEWDPVSAWRLSRHASRPDTREASIFHAHTGHTALLASMASKLAGRCRPGAPIPWARAPIPWVAHRRVDFALSGRLSRRLKYDAAGAVVAVSENIRRILADSGVAAEKIEVIHDCLPLTQGEAAAAGVPLLLPPTQAEKASARAAVARELGIPENGAWVVNLAALVGHKDHATLIRAAAAVRRERPDAVFLILGDGPLREGLERLARELGLEGSVFLAGFRKDAADWLSAADAYVQSSWGEGMGSVLLEAMAKGVPIAATDAGGIPEVLEDGRSARLVPARDSGALARAILDILSFPEEARRLAEAAREDLTRFSMSRACVRIEVLYASLLGVPVA